MCWNWYLYLTAGNGMITNWDLGNSRARMMNTGWATTTSMTCSLEVQIFSLHRFLSNLHEIVHLTGRHFLFRRELIKDWPDGLGWGKTLCSLWKFPACEWAGKKWREWRFPCFICEGGASACAASDFSIRVVITALQNSPALVPWDSWFGWLTNSPGRRHISLRLLPHNCWAPKPPGDRITCALSLTLLLHRGQLSAAGHRGSHVHLPPVSWLKQSSMRDEIRVWTSARKLNPVVLLPRRLCQAVT